MTLNPIATAIALVLAIIGFLAAAGGAIAVAIVLIALAVVVLASLKMARQWERAVVLRAGRFSGVKGPGLYGIVDLRQAAPPPAAVAAPAP